MALNTDYLRGIGQDVITATFDPQGASHQRYAADQAAAAQAKIDDENRVKILQQYQQQYQQQPNQITSPAVTPTAAPVSDPFAGLRPQQQARLNQYAQRKGMTGEDVRSLYDKRRGVGSEGKISKAALDNQYAQSPALSLEEWNKANSFDPKQGMYINQEWGPNQQNSYTTVKSPTVMNKSYSPYQMYLNEYNAAKTVGAGPIKATIDNPNKAEDYYYYTLGKGANTAAKKGFTVPTW